MVTLAWWQGRYDDVPEILVGQRVRSLREAQKLTQANLATRMIGVGFPALRQSAIAKIEAGKRTLTLSEALGLAAVLGVDIKTLLRSERDERSEMLRGQKKALDKAEKDAIDAAEVAEEARLKAEHAAAQLADLRARYAANLAAERSR